MAIEPAMRPLLVGIRVDSGSCFAEVKSSTKSGVPAKHDQGCYAGLFKSMKKGDISLDEIVAEARNKDNGSADEGVIYALNLLDQKPRSHPNWFATMARAK